MGGERRGRARRESVRRQHRRHRLRAAPQRQSPVDLHRRQLGLDDAGVHGRRLELLGLARSQHLPARAHTATPSGTRSRPGSSSPRRRSGLTGPSTSARSTPSCTRSTPPRERRGGRSPPAITSTALRRSGTTVTATPTRSTSPRPTARSTTSRRAASSAGATTPATRSAPRRCSGPRRSASTARSSTSAPPTASCTRSNASTGRRRWSFDTTPRDPGAARSQRPQRLAGARQDRRLHRRRGRLRRLRALRLLPAPSRPRAARPIPAQEFGNSARPRVPRQRRRQHARRPRRFATSRRATVINLRLIVRRHGTHRQRLDARPGPGRDRHAPLPVHDPGVRRRPFPLRGAARDCCAQAPPTGCGSPGTTPTTACTWATSTRTARVGRQLRPDDHACSTRRRRARPLPLSVRAERSSARDDPPPRGADAGVPALGQPDRIRQLRLDRLDGGSHRARTC